jgi:hypothetical protein
MRMVCSAGFVEGHRRVGTGHERAAADLEGTDDVFRRNSPAGSERASVQQIDVAVALDSCLSLKHAVLAGILEDDSRQQPKERAVLPDVGRVIACGAHPDPPASFLTRSSRRKLSSLNQNAAMSVRLRLVRWAGEYRPVKNPAAWLDQANNARLRSYQWRVAVAGRRDTAD